MNVLSSEQNWQARSLGEYMSLCKVKDWNNREEVGVAFVGLKSWQGYYLWGVV